jgi:hypothetical protein
LADEVLDGVPVAGTVVTDPPDDGLMTVFLPPIVVV